MAQPGHPAPVEDLTCPQVAAGGYHAPPIRSDGTAGGHPALVEDLTYTQVALEVAKPARSGAMVQPEYT